jgi:hypothetical protein
MCKMFVFMYGANGLMQTSRLVHVCMHVCDNGRMCVRIYAYMHA